MFQKREMHDKLDKLNLTANILKESDLRVVNMIIHPTPRTTEFFTT